jgi:DNA-binding NarL/FixJ family response regulator
VFNLVGTATNGHEAIALARVVRPDVVVVVDHHVDNDAPRLRPGCRSPMTGLDLIPFLRSCLRGALIVVYSGMRGIERSIYEAGTDRHFLKSDIDPEVPLHG